MGGDHDVFMVTYLILHRRIGRWKVDFLNVGKMYKLLAKDYYHEELSEHLLTYGKPRQPSAPV